MCGPCRVTGVYSEVGRLVRFLESQLPGSLSATLGGGTVLRFFKLLFVFGLQLGFDAGRWPRCSVERVVG